MWRQTLRALRTTAIDTHQELRLLFEHLTGQKSVETAPLPTKAIEVLERGSGWGYSQFNEVLLLLGYDRVCPELFQFVVDGSTEYNPSSALRTIGQLRDAVTRFRTLGLLLFGNVKFAFKRFRTDPDELIAWLNGSSSTSKRQRSMIYRTCSCVSVSGVAFSE